jgi:hypothetical protein
MVCATKTKRCRFFTLVCTVLGLVVPTPIDGFGFSVSFLLVMGLMTAFVAGFAKEIGVTG